jgi:hypothetical protein
MTITAPPAATRRGTSNRNDRGSSYARRARRAWLILTYASNLPGFARCYRCGCLLFNPDDFNTPYEAACTVPEPWAWPLPQPLTVDRIIPGCQGGTYRRTNIRPACGGCNSETGGQLAGTGKGKRK